jgi:hypothetical protein
MAPIQRNIYFVTIALILGFAAFVTQACTSSKRDRTAWVKAFADNASPDNKLVIIRW